MEIIPKRVFFDLDGVLSNFAGGVGHYISPEDDLKHFMNHGEGRKKEFWINLSPYSDGLALLQRARNADVEVHILSAYPNDCLDKEAVRQGKRQWVRDHLGIRDICRVHIVPREDKKLYAHPLSLLIDDKEKNVLEFCRAGGTGWLHENFPGTLNFLERWL